ncbi:group II intron reverse transcriptase domain-containing protein [Candidatus Saccharibacteria bacterium]|nr:group II intron reverse transcriptase domain-containing protein [Candidatus Saccharibacteria bacterium]
MIQLRNTHHNIISTDNLLLAWKEFIVGKRSKPDVQVFARSLGDNILLLHDQLVEGDYKHSGYYEFAIFDPKPRQIHKAAVRDRVLNHAVYRVLYPFFDQTFIYDSYSCRKAKGTHAALQRFRQFAVQVSRNNTRTCWVLKCDIRKFFASINQNILLEVLSAYIPNPEVMRLLSQIVESFETNPDRGLPLGNLTSQLFVNIYMNVFDQFIKHRLKVRCYLRYADDFVLLADDRDWLLAQIPLMQDFLQEKLDLTMHPQKISLQTFASGIDFLGWVNFPHHRVLRTRTKQRMLRRLGQSSSEATMQSYLGLLSHGNSYEFQQMVRNSSWLWQ